MFAAATAGKLQFRFDYAPPGEEDPTYHTAIWLENEAGKYVKTLFVTGELAGTEWKLGNACPDWVKQSNWEKAEKAAAAAVTGPTPQVGMGGLEFNLADMGVAPGKYVIKFQVHVIREYNIMFQGKVEVGGPAQDVKIEKLYSPKKLEIGTEVVEEVRVNYVP